MLKQMWKIVNGLMKYICKGLICYVMKNCINIKFCISTHLYQDPIKQVYLKIWIFFISFKFNDMNLFLKYIIAHNLLLMVVPPIKKAFYSLSHYK